MVRERPWRIVEDGVALRLRATPRAHCDALEAEAVEIAGGMAVKARVRCAPHDGQANDALKRLLAEFFEVAPSRVTLMSGAGGRVKIFKIAGAPECLAARLEKFLTPATINAKDAK